ncbi:hypothetical protein LPN04_22235 [Rugamonas sp. A1-17]|nr:hypothetical protein [Rugamonas sp. A1-17]
MRTFIVLTAIGAALFATAAQPATTIQLASLEWMPFSGATLPGDGLSGTVVAEVEKRLGNDIKVKYFEWKETVAKGESDPEYSGYFPVYYTAERAESKCAARSPAGKALQEAFDAELKKVDTAKLEAAYLKRLEAGTR